MILCLETATPVCSVALCNRSGLVLVRENQSDRSHATQLTQFIGEILKESGLKAGDLEAVAVSKGPGSYTGLRIGVSVAKGIAYGASVPLIGIDTTKSMFNGLISDPSGKYGSDESTLFCPMIDARRMEVYYSVFDARGNVVKEISAEIINEKSFSDVPEDVRIIFFGEGSNKIVSVAGHKNSIFIRGFLNSATFMQKPAFDEFDAHHFEDVAYFEPFYLKNFIATIQRKNIIVK
jgi:tRNA threonylcarbamoyladenosine biosynthesis protein TsaB